MISEKLMYWFSKPVVKSYTSTMLKMDVLRYEKMPKGAKIVAANHPATSDPFFVAAMVGHQSFILINEVLFYVPVLGAYLRRSGHIPVEVGKGQEAVDAAVNLLKHGRTVIIFPEGALSPQEGGFCQARTGVARLALESGAPVFPAGIHLQRERIRNLQSHVRGEVQYSRWYPRGQYNITVGQALSFKGDVGDRPLVRQIASTIMHHIIELARQSEFRMAGSLPSFTGLAAVL